MTIQDRSVPVLLVRTKPKKFSVAGGATPLQLAQAAAAAAAAAAGLSNFIPAIYAAGIGAEASTRARIIDLLNQPSSQDLASARAIAGAAATSAAATGFTPAALSAQAAARAQAAAAADRMFSLQRAASPRPSSVKQAEIDRAIADAVSAQAAVDAARLIGGRQLDTARLALTNAKKKLAALYAKAVNNPKAELPPSILEVDLTEFVEDFEFDDDEKHLQKLSITLWNEDLRWLDSPLLDKNETLIFSFGYVGNLSPFREAVIQKTTGSIRLKIEALDKGVLMHKVKRTRTFKNMTRAQVVERVAEENGYGPRNRFIDHGAKQTYAGGSNGSLGRKLVLAIKAEAAKYPTDFAQIAKLAAEGKKANIPGLQPYFMTVLGITENFNEKSPPLWTRNQITKLSDIVISKAGAAPKAAKPVPRAKTAVSYPTIVQANETDAQFIKRLAVLQGFELTFDIDGLHWEPRQLNTRPMKTYTYFLSPGVGDIEHYEIDKTMIVNPGEIQVKGQDPLKKETFTETAKADTVPRTKLSPDLYVLDPKNADLIFKKGDAIKDVQATSASTKAEAKVEAQGQYKQSVMMSIQLKMTLVGDPNLQRKMIVKVVGIGKKIEGKYYVSSVKHSIGSNGYKIDAVLRTDGGNKSAGPKPQDAGTQNTQKATDGSNGPGTKPQPTYTFDKRTGDLIGTWQRK